MYMYIMSHLTFYSILQISFRVSINLRILVYIWDHTHSCARDTLKAYLR